MKGKIIQEKDSRVFVCENGLRFPVERVVMYNNSTVAQIQVKVSDFEIVPDEVRLTVDLELKESVNKASKVIDKCIKLLLSNSETPEQQAILGAINEVQDEIAFLETDIRIITEPKNPYVQITESDFEKKCPRCESTEIFETKEVSIAGLVNGMRFYCVDCDKSFDLVPDYKRW